MYLQSLGIVTGAPDVIEKLALGLHHEVTWEIIVQGTAQSCLIAPSAYVDTTEHQFDDLHACAEKILKAASVMIFTVVRHNEDVWACSAAKGSDSRILPAQTDRDEAFRLCEEIAGTPMLWRRASMTILKWEARA